MPAGLLWGSPFGHTHCHPTSTAESSGVIIGIDVNALTRNQRTGTERYLFSVLREMMKSSLQPGEQVILYSSAVVADLGKLPAGWSWKILDWPLQKGWTHARLSFELLVQPPDVFWNPVHEIPTFHRHAKIVSTIHDVAFRRLPGIYSEKGTTRQEWAVARAVKESAAIISVSQTTKNDLVELYGLSAEKIFVTHLAVDETLHSMVDRPFSEANENYFLTIGRLEKKKNIANLVRAFGRVVRDTPPAKGEQEGVRLVLAGSWGFGAEEIKEAIAESGCADRIITPGYVSDEEAHRLLAGAIAYVFPSYYEGFGIPALEAMQAGVPLIASDILALREVAGEAAMFVAPTDVEGWAVAMDQLLLNENLRLDLIKKGSERVKAFDWAKTADKTWEVLRAVAYAKFNA